MNSSLHHAVSNIVLQQLVCNMDSQNFTLCNSDKALVTCLRFVALSLRSLSTASVVGLSLLRTESSSSPAPRKNKRVHTVSQTIREHFHAMYIFKRSTQNLHTVYVIVTPNINRNLSDFVFFFRCFLLLNRQMNIYKHEGSPSHLQTIPSYCAPSLGWCLSVEK